MKTYRKNFQSYLNDLAARKPAPGGGSAAALIFCLGMGLMEKAMRYSLNDKPQLAKLCSVFEKLRKQVYNYIDLDGQLFNAIMASTGKRRDQFIKKSEKVIVDMAQACFKVFSLVKLAESDIKKGILSDFKIGVSCTRITLEACADNLEANNRLFKRENKFLPQLRKYLVCSQQSGENR
jgi:formiminotetrahydrofolate cyclodeaminase